MLSLWVQGYVFEFRVCLRVESPGFGMEGCEFVSFWILLFLGFRIWFRVVQNAACQGMSLAFEDWGVSGSGLRA